MLDKVVMGWSLVFSAVCILFLKVPLFSCLGDHSLQWWFHQGARDNNTRPNELCPMNIQYRECTSQMEMESSVHSSSSWSAEKGKGKTYHIKGHSNTSRTEDLTLFQSMQNYSWLVSFLLNTVKAQRIQFLQLYCKSNKVRK